jgi:hypothetical protein
MLTNRAAESKSKLTPHQMNRDGCWVAKGGAKKMAGEANGVYLSADFFRPKPCRATIANPNPNKTNVAGSGTAV